MLHFSMCIYIYTHNSYICKPYKAKADAQQKYECLSYKAKAEKYDWICDLENKKR